MAELNLQALQVTWNKLSQKLINEVAENFNKRLNVKAGGGQFKYSVIGKLFIMLFE